jgi:hypothetical protein
MTRINRYLLKILGLGWLCFLLAGLAINQVYTGQIILIDRSYCPSSQWQVVVQSYQQIYQQPGHIQTVILFNDLGEETLTSAPTPETIQKLSTYGRSSKVRQAKLEKHYPTAKLLSCHP